MGKNHRHSKNLKTEKSKIHLKSKTKFLPKGQNVTDTTFKIRPIVVQEQLKRVVEEKTSYNKTKLSVSDVLQKLRQNGKVKVTACSELIELIETTSTQEIVTNLQLIMRNVVGLIQDRERTVRKAVVKLIACLLKKVPQDKFKAFFAHISANLRCAMTHMDKRIQEDSLPLLDALLELAPNLIAESCFRILSDFLVMISKQTGTSTNTNVNTLSIGLTRKMTSAEWRIQVLMRVDRVFNFLIDRKMSDGHVVNRSRSLPEPIAITEYADCGLSTDFDFFQVGSRDFSLNLAQDDVSSVTLENWSALLSSLLSVLDQIWIEVKPDSNQTITETTTTALSEEVATVFSYIVQILLLVQRYISPLGVETPASIMEFNKLVDHLASSFPFVKISKRSHKSPSMTSHHHRIQQHNDSKLNRENLTLIYLVVENCHQVGRRNSYSKKMEHFLKELLTSRHFGKSNLDIFLTLIDRLLVNSKSWRGFDMLDIMEKITQLFEIVDDEFKSRILKTLTKSNLFLECERFSKWLENLPKLLCKKALSEDVIEEILNLTRLNCCPVLKGFQENLAEICDNLAKLKVVGSDEARIKMSVVYSLLYVINSNPENVQVVEKFIFDKKHEEPLLCTHFSSMLNFVIR